MDRGSPRLGLDFGWFLGYDTMLLIRLTWHPCEAATTSSTTCTWRMWSVNCVTHKATRKTINPTMQQQCCHDINTATTSLLSDLLSYALLPTIVLGCYPHVTSSLFLIPILNVNLDICAHNSISPVFAIMWKDCMKWHTALGWNVVGSAVGN